MIKSIISTKKQTDWQHQVYSTQTKSFELENHQTGYVLLVRRLQMKTLNHRLYAKRLWMFCLSIGLYVIHGQRAIKLDLTKFKSNIERANDLMILLTAQHCDWHWPVFFFLIASLDVWWSNLIPPPPPNNNDGLRLRIEEKNLAYYSWTKLWRRASKFVKARK